MMDAKYYSKKILKLMPMFHNLAINLVGEDEPDINEILRQIALDARREALEEAKGAVGKCERVVAYPGTVNIKLSDALAAISSLEVK
jgi:hypothetical protein